MPDEMPPVRPDSDAAAAPSADAPAAPGTATPAGQRGTTRHRVVRWKGVIPLALAIALATIGYVLFAEPIVRGSLHPAFAAASCAFQAAIRADSSRFIWPAPIPAVTRSLA